MDDQHARLSRALAEQRITKRWEQAAHARQGRGGGLLRRRHQLRASRWRQQAHRPAGQVVSRRQSDTPQAPVDQEPVTPRASSGPWATLLRVAWLAILLGLLLQVAMLLVAAGFGADISPRPVLAETLKTVSWSLLVCVGVALGRVTAKGQVPLEGLTGLLAAPLALTAANAIQKGIAEALDIAGVPAGPVPVWVLVIKAAEYGCLGLALEWVGRRAWHSVLGHLAVGLVTGVVFGGVFLALVVQSAPTPLSTSSLLARGLNELLFPVGCALVVFIAEVLRTHVDPAAQDPCLKASPAGADEPAPDPVLDGVSSGPVTLTVGPLCGLDRGHWACLSHRRNFRTRRSLDRHTGLGEHRLVWLCWAHGPEQPSPGPARHPGGHQPGPGRARQSSGNPHPHRATGKGSGMTNQHAGLSQALAAQRITQRHQRAAHARLLRGARPPRRRRTRWAARRWWQLTRWPGVATNQPAHHPPRVN